MVTATSSTGGPRRRWSDMIRQDLKGVGVYEAQWYNEAVTSRESLRALCRKILVLEG